MNMSYIFLNGVAQEGLQKWVDMKPMLGNLCSPDFSYLRHPHTSFTTTKPSFSTQTQLDKIMKYTFHFLSPCTGAMEENTLGKIMVSHFEFFCLISEPFHRRDSWQMWENFSRVAADIGNFSQALEAVQKVLDMTKKKRIDVELLERMLQELELRTSTSHSECYALRDSSDSAEAVSNMINVDPFTSSDKDLAIERETEHLIQSVGKILRQIVQTGGKAEIWGLYARWHKLKGDLAMCSEALLKQIRSYQGSDLWKDKDRFAKFAHASLELCKVYQEIARHNGSGRELSAAEMHLKNTIKQAEAFSNTKEYQDILACLDEVKAAQATP